MINTELSEPRRPLMRGVTQCTDHYDIGSMVDQLSLFWGLPPLYM